MNLLLVALVSVILATGVFNTKPEDSEGNKQTEVIVKESSETKPTEEEVNAKISELEKNEPHRLLREERNKRLAECDWVVTKYAEYGYNIPKEWRTYRQALRDLPSISYRPELNEFGHLKMDSVAWPTPPE